MGMFSDLANANDEKSESQSDSLEIPKLDNFFTASDVLEETPIGLKLAIHGRPGVGKSYLCLSAPLPIYAFDTENSLIQILQNIDEERKKQIYIRPVKRINKKTLDIDPIESLREIELGLEAIRRANLTKGTVVMDSGTDLYQYILGTLRMQILEVDPTANVRPADYAWSNNKYDSIWAKLRALKMNVIMTFKDAQDWVSAGQPGTTWSPKWNRNTPYLADSTFVLKKIPLGSSFKYVAKCEKFRLKRIDIPDIQDVNFDKIIEEIKKQGADLNLPGGNLNG